MLLSYLTNYCYYPNYVNGKNIQHDTEKIIYALMLLSGSFILHRKKGTTVKNISAIQEDFIVEKIGKIFNNTNSVFFKFKKKNKDK